MEVKIEESWKEQLKEVFETPTFKGLSAFVKSEYTSSTVYPAPKNIFRAFDLCPFEKVKVVIIGQDPYHGAGQANGLCFSVSMGVTKPPSLNNIFKELNRDLGIPVPIQGDLGNWADQGVLLLNATLTVRAGLAGSHQGRGWEIFTDAAIRALSAKRKGIVFLLWGKFAQTKQTLINHANHFILTAAHPSPLAGNRFSGCGHFSKTNDLLRMQGLEDINWNIS